MVPLSVTRVFLIMRSCFFDMLLSFSGSDTTWNLLDLYWFSSRRRLRSSSRFLSACTHKHVRLGQWVYSG